MLFFSFFFKTTFFIDIKIHVHKFVRFCEEREFLVLTSRSTLCFDNVHILTISWPLLSSLLNMYVSLLVSCSTIFQSSPFHTNQRMYTCLCACLCLDTIYLLLPVACSQGTKQPITRLFAHFDNWPTGVPLFAFCNCSNHTLVFLITSNNTICRLWNTCWKNFLVQNYEIAHWQTVPSFSLVWKLILPQSYFDKTSFLQFVPIFHLLFLLPHNKSIYWHSSPLSFFDIMFVTTDCSHPPPPRHFSNVLGLFLTILNIRALL